MDLELSKEIYCNIMDNVSEDRVEEALVAIKAALSAVNTIRENQMYKEALQTAVLSNASDNGSWQ